MMYKTVIEGKTSEAYSYDRLSRLYDAALLPKDTVILEDDKSYNFNGSKLEKQLHQKNSLTLWLLAIIPLTVRILSSFFLDDNICMIIYFILSFLFLLLDWHMHKHNPYINLYSIILGLLLLPYYLFYRKSNFRINYGPLIAWVILFIVLITLKTM